MAFNTSNYSGSVVYENYKKVFNFIQSNTVVPDTNFSPYSVLSDIKNKFNFNDVATINIASKDSAASTDRLNTYFNSVIPYFSINYVCADEKSQIKNTGKTFEELKVPIDYFTDGRLFGIKTRFDSIKNGKPLTQTEGWTFFDSFDNTKKISNTDDLNKVIEGIFYNTLFKYFNTDGYYGFSLINASDRKYTRKSATAIKNGETIYTPGIGEAPNYLDISVDSFQKIKNKVSIKSSAVRTNYVSTLLPPKQIEFNDTKEEFLSGILLNNPPTPPIDAFSNYKTFALLTSLSQETSSKIIKNYINSVADYFNLVHYILKNAIIDFEFYKKYSSFEDDIFFDYEKNILIFLNYKSYKNDPNATNLGIYTKELLINLLNLVGDENSVNDLCNTFLDFLEENEPQIVGNYKREELFNIFKQLNQAAYDTFREPTPQKTIPSNNGKVKTNLRVSNLSFDDQVVHSNSVTLQKVYVYRTNEKPFTYEDILQDEKLYKILDLELDTTGLIPKTVEDNVTLIDDIQTNTKYYYCFLSEREYDVYKEVLNYFEGSRIVKHFSSPTKILELEMISTENSTYLDYNFYTPEQKEFYNKNKNFLSKIKVSASDLQKNYDPQLERFVAPKGVMQLWDNTVKLVDSYDLGKGLTVKLRLSSPKTNKKIDLNLRYFLNDQINLGEQFKEVKEEDIKNYANGKKYKEVASVLMPEIITSLKQKTPKGEIINSDPKLKIKYLINKTVNPNQVVYKIENLFAYLKINDLNNPPIKDYLSSVNYEINIYSKQGNRSEFIYPGQPIYLNKNENLQDLSLLKLSNVDLVPNTIKTVIVEQLVQDKYGFNYPNKVEFLTEFAAPTYNIIPDKISVNEGQPVKFTVNTINVFNGTKLSYKVEASTKYNIIKDLSVVTGEVAIQNNSATFQILAIADMLTEGAESFIVQLFDGTTKVAETDLITINDTSMAPTFKLTVPTTMNEGTGASFIVNTTNYTGSPIPWEIKNPGNNFVGSTSGFVSIINNAGNFIVNVANNQIKEGNRKFDVVLKAPTGDITASFTVIDTSSEQYIITPNYLSTDEGQGVSFVVDTPYKKDGEIVYWQINSIQGTVNESDFSTVLVSNASGLPAISATKLNGSFVVKSKQGSVSFMAANDSLTEGTEKFSLSVKDTSSGAVVKTSEVITINDTSLAPALKCGLVPNYSNGIGSFSGTYITVPISLLGITIPSAPITIKNNQALVTGSVSGTVWGSGPYTSDSNWGAAAVHAGLIKSGEKAIIEFKDSAELSNFTSSTKNGVTTTSYNGKWCSFNISLVSKVI